VVNEKRERGVGTERRRAYLIGGFVALGLVVKAKTKACGISISCGFGSLKDVVLECASPIDTRGVK